MNWNLINTILLSIICFFVISIFLLDISFNMSWKASITDWLSVIIYACTFGAAIWAGITARKALNENKRMAIDNKRLVDSQTEPFVDISLEVMPESVNWIRLRIQNLGLSSAFNITFTVKNLSPQTDSSKLIIDQFFGISFMKHGLSYLSKGDFRYSGFINLLESDEARGFSIDDFLSTKFTVIVAFKDIRNKPHTAIFNISINELSGIYRIGKSFEEQLIAEMKGLNTKLTYINNMQKNFNYEYEKIHRGWTEADLKRTLSLIQTRRIQSRGLNQPSEEERYTKPNRKQSINQLRKQNK
ncbi:hypothetical protein AY605_14575 [Acinetobacter sp. SFD]|uniref:hypothetical protein n=1 Tax=Acinetobacter sp. SFD TaxID=1805635 RepID=UPI0007D048B5|nr:hypothetical protein [Acinetobacter sp. SFD]OAL85819.1 hypothetical protein AY605_14575 [Acinetobacter sp. SFD]